MSGVLTYLCSDVQVRVITSDRYNAELKFAISLVTVGHTTAITFKRLTVTCFLAAVSVSMVMTIAAQGDGWSYKEWFARLRANLRFLEGHM